jgi:CheY-like chemotaxis protein
MKYKKLRNLLRQVIDPQSPDDDIEGRTMTQVATPTTKAPGVPKPRVLLVEDDAAVAEMYAFALEGRGFIVERATTALEAIAVGRSLLCEVIVLDIGLPDRSGIDVLAELGTEPGMPPLTVLIFSNFDEPTMIQKAYDLGAFDYLIKAETTPATLVQVVSMMLTGDRPPAGDAEQKGTVVPPALRPSHPA